MNRVDRLFGIVTLLQSRKYVSAEKISEKFEISVRTVYRDIKAIGEAGIPVSFEPNKGYFIIPGYFTPPVSFTLDEANALLLSQSLIGGFGDRSVQSTFDSALTKIKAVLKQVDKEKLALLDQSIKLQLPERLNFEFEYLSKIQHAIIEQTQIKITYRSLKDELSERVIEPIGLVFYAFSWHLIGYCQLRGDYRDFKVERIKELRSTHLPFETTSHISLSDYKLPVNY
ncbi:MAG: DeoR family transcriptional regulator [Fluviicola sp.]|jgi:predicted DNA-binding transcriptional regulator YafY|uniref:helix-turn-helix transcriptional regulator n=1 Tax=Fluviicola sp. TaxID=1917219 RepID=UPI002639EF9D|nr:YafY family protein [Fluviicola sp.]MDF3026804.1 DeoR family transcriptional regulator [Fluviicola sp.]